MNCLMMNGNLQNDDSDNESNDNSEGTVYGFDDYDSSEENEHTGSYLNSSTLNDDETIIYNINDLQQNSDNINDLAHLNNDPLKNLIITCVMKGNQMIKKLI